MKWPTPLNPGSITGQQTLTGDRPITMIHRAIKEIQDYAITEAEITIGGKPLTCKVVGNKLTAFGDSENPSSSQALSGTITYLTGAAVELSSNGSDTLTVRLSFSAQTLNLATGEVSDATIPDSTDSVTGGPCG